MSQRSKKTVRKVGRQRRHGPGPAALRRPEPRRPDPPRQPPTRVAEGQIEPLTLGEDGLWAETKQRRWRLSGGVIGERVLVALPRRGDQAHIKGIVDPSPVRRAAPCPLLSRCGACSLQEMDYRAQIEAKSEALRRSLAPLGCPADRVRDVCRQPNPFGYRTKLLMPAGGRRGALRFGFYQRGTLRLVAAEGCPVQHPLTLACLASVRQLLDEHMLGPSTQHDGWLHAIAVRVDPCSGSCELTLCGKTPRVPGGERLAAQLAAVPGVATVHLTAQPERSSFPIGPRFKHVAGGRRSVFHLASRPMMLSPGTFFQSSAAGAELLANEVLALLPRKVRCLADLYGGAGTFTRISAGRWQRALVVDDSPSAVADLRHHLRGASYGDAVTAIAGRLENKAREVFARDPDVALLDPPRRGCAEAALAALVEAKPPLVIYAACGFDSLLRDARALLAAGYTWREVRAVDMFPHTPHLEVIAALAL